MPESPLTPTYEPAPVEAKWSAFWEQHGFFQPDPSRAATPYCIVIPPPNITGSLHLGHALNNTLQDILIRWRRMCGDAALWVPGTDHAGIATQNVVERQLMAEKKSREQLGRQAFIERVWSWHNQSGRSIITQLKRLGASCDWSREAFTMDEPRAAAVREAFVRLFNDGLIYRGQRLINWCPRCQTALSDIEVEHNEVPGKMYHLAYPLADDPKTVLTVATTRPETLLGDTAVAVHPDDPRFNRFIGRKVLLPLTTRLIPVVGDAILVDREFGTGAVKITPAHDFNDEKAGQRHGAPKIAILDRQARITSEIENVGSEVMGKIMLLDVQEARAGVVELLKRGNHLVKVEEHTHTIGTCYRCHTVVEPYDSPQWFVRVNDPKNSLAQPAIDAVRDGRIQFIPEGWKNNYFGWMEQIQDWCISRQIWWGHQIPAWYCRTCNKGKLASVEYNRNTPQKPLTSQSRELDISPDQMEIEWWISADAKPIVAKEKPERCDTCGGTALIQDPDVLDTWFSSALWPFSTLGWPAELQPNPEERKKAEEMLKRFYPTSTLVTSFDIIFFWVARMIMMGLKFMGDVPFRNVYIHALVRDAEGQKMSKSKGNVIDPLVMMDKYGTDALRFTLAAMASPGRDIRLSEERIAGYRNFANKLWNAARFTLMNLDGPRDGRPVAERSLSDRWIISRLQRCIGETTEALQTYRFDEAANRLYHFTWNEYCDWYIEFSKPALLEKDSAAAALTRATLAESFETLLRQLHPFMPFITEELWQAIPHAGESVMAAPYPNPQPALIDEVAERDIAIIQELIVGFREMRKVHGIAPSQKLPGAILLSDQTIKQTLARNEKILTSAARLSALTYPAERPLRTFSGSIMLPGGMPVELFIIPPDETMELSRDRVKETKVKRLSELTTQLERDEKTLANAQFLAKAPPQEVEKIKNRRREFQVEKESVLKELARLNGPAEGA